MAHTFRFIVEVELERVSGKFAPRDEMAEAIQEALEGADEGTFGGLGVDGDSDYDVVNWSVEEER